MTQEDKQLLLKDLCARLPYNLWAEFEGKEYLITGYGHGRVSLLTSMFSSAVGPCPLVEEVKPYLRPMSSMTRDESFELGEIMLDLGSSNVMANVIDFYSEHHLDFRYLIPMGLALEAPEDMYKTE